MCFLSTNMAFPTSTCKSALGLRLFVPAAARLLHRSKNWEFRDLDRAAPAYA
jgi:hypothetical protein